ncbi:MAG: hypothetical protein HZB16_03160 [Armatimonadetes bacterium]|nr:hypothetical protein [Armatimonadota bacterium]
MNSLPPGWETWLDAELARVARARSVNNAERLQADLCACLRLDAAPGPGGQSPIRQSAPPIAGRPVTRLVYAPWSGVSNDALSVEAEPGRPRLLLLHDLDGSPEVLLATPLAQTLAAAGFGLLAPRLVPGWRARLRVARKARLLGLEWLGLEVLALRRLMDQVPSYGWGVVGYSRGGQAALLLAALDPRPRAVVVASWFCDRDKRLLDTRDSRLTAFLDSPEDEQFLPGWWRRFDDGVLAALLAPRPLLITSGLDDPVLPFELVQDAFAAAERHYRAVGALGNLRLSLLPGGHVPQAEVTAEWLAAHLGAEVDLADMPLRPPPGPARHPAVRMARERRKKVAALKRIGRR